MSPVFEKSAWGGPTHTVNVLVHLQTDDKRASNLRICGDRRGRCDDGEFGQYKWVEAETQSGQDTYILEGLAKLREQPGCDA